MVGASPSFSDVHIVRTILALKNGKIGRKRLVKFLGLGEGSVRTILKRLKKQSFINSDKYGHELTQKGKVKAREYLSKFTMPKDLHPDDLIKGFKSIVILHSTSDKIKSGMEQRDLALSNGADGAMILIFKNKKLEFPTPSVKLSDFPETKKELDRLKLKEKDVVVISFAKSKASAEDGSIAIALDLIG